MKHLLSALVSLASFIALTTPTFATLQTVHYSETISQTDGVTVEWTSSYNGAKTYDDGDLIRDVRNGQIFVEVHPSLFDFLDRVPYSPERGHFTDIRPRAPYTIFFSEADQYLTLEEVEDPLLIQSSNYYHYSFLNSNSSLLVTRDAELHLYTEWSPLGDFEGVHTLSSTEFLPTTGEEGYQRVTEEEIFDDLLSTNTTFTIAQSYSSDDVLLDQHGVITYADLTTGQNIVIYVGYDVTEGQLGAVSVNPGSVYSPILSQNSPTELYDILNSYLARLEGDLNHDGAIDLADFNILKSTFNQELTLHEELQPGNLSYFTSPDGDITDNGVVNLQDFGILKQNFGSSANVQANNLLDESTLESLNDKHALSSDPGLTTPIPLDLQPKLSD